MVNRRHATLLAGGRSYCKKMLVERGLFSPSGVLTPSPWHWRNTCSTFAAQREGSPPRKAGTMIDDFENELLVAMLEGTFVETLRASEFGADSANKRMLRLVGLTVAKDAGPNSALGHSLHRRRSARGWYGLTALSWTSFKLRNQGLESCAANSANMSGPSLSDVAEQPARHSAVNDRRVRDGIV